METGDGAGQGSNGKYKLKLPATHGIFWPSLVGDQLDDTDYKTRHIRNAAI